MIAPEAFSMCVGGIYTWLSSGPFETFARSQCVHGYGLCVQMLCGSWCVRRVTGCIVRVLLQTNRLLSKVILQLRVQVQVKMTSITVKTTQLLIHFDLWVCVCVLGRATKTVQFSVTGLIIPNSMFWSLCLVCFHVYLLWAWTSCCTDVLSRFMHKDDFWHGCQHLLQR